MDRNDTLELEVLYADGSLSARRAWIEIRWQRAVNCYDGVALRKESVDRNFELLKLLDAARRSLSARRAWIEIARLTFNNSPVSGRSPQGERG